MYRNSLSKTSSDDELAEVELPRCDSLSVLYDAIKIAAISDGRVRNHSIRSINISDIIFDLINFVIFHIKI